MKEEKSFNIFDAAGKKKSANSKKPSPPSKIEKPSTPKEAESPPPSIPTDNINEMLKEMENLRDDLKNKFEEACFNGGINPKFLESYTDTMKNSETWKALEQERQKLEQKVKDTVGKLEKTPSKEKRVAAQMNKERKSKTLGDRKKWIPMR